MAENRRLVSVSPISADNLPQSIDELVQISNTNFDNDVVLSDDVWNKQINRMKSDKFKSFHPQKAIKFGPFLNKKFAIKLKTDQDSGELSKCVEFIASVNRWPADKREKYLKAIDFKPNDNNDVNSPDEPAYEKTHVLPTFCAEHFYANRIF